MENFDIENTADIKKIVEFIIDNDCNQSLKDVFGNPYMDNGYGTIFFKFLNRRLQILALTVKFDKIVSLMFIGNFDITINDIKRITNNVLVNYVAHDDLYCHTILFTIKNKTCYLSALDKLDLTKNETIKINTITISFAATVNT